MKKTTRLINQIAGPKEYVRYVQLRTLWLRLHIDLPLLLGLVVLSGCGLVVLYSAGNEDISLLFRQGVHLILAFGLMFIIAQIPPNQLKTWAPWIFAAGLILLFAVLIMGKIGKGAQRWLDIGVMRFQPSEILKLAMPMTLASFFANRPIPPSKSTLAIAGLMLLIPSFLIAKQPDLGSAFLIAFSGCSVLLLVGMSWKIIFSLIVTLTTCLPIGWHYLHDYQRQRVLTFLNPELDPLDSGYHIIQSKIAIGSGGLFGKGWLNGTQSHLHFLPEHTTDFIFAVVGEEFGFIGALILLAIYVYIIARGFSIANQAQDSFGRLLAGSITLTFFICLFINISMVCGILPVVGIPLPLVSYGGTSIVTTILGFGVLMSIHTHRKLLPA